MNRACVQCRVDGQPGIVNREAAGDIDGAVSWPAPRCIDEIDIDGRLQHLIICRFTHQGVGRGKSHGALPRKTITSGIDFTSYK